MLLILVFTCLYCLLDGLHLLRVLFLIDIAVDHRSFSFSLELDHFIFDVVLLKVLESFCLLVRVGHLFLRRYLLVLDLDKGALPRRYLNLAKVRIIVTIVTPSAEWILGNLILFHQS